MLQKIILLVSCCFFFSQNLMAQHDNLDKKNIAIQGYDPVAYFTVGKAVKGDKKFSTTHKNAIYRFSSAANKALFVESPEKYAPQYGGWCAYAIGETGEKVSINPSTFKILNGKLYLFYNENFTNTLKLWNKNEAVLLEKAIKNWSKIISK
ncbi:MAG: hypothetical protein RL757_73 [Bacteroidota bacterium]|jgi:YHS domain-containing protein